MSKLFTHSQLLALLLTKKGARPFREFAREIGIAPSTLSNILCGHRRADGTAILSYLGMERVTYFVYRKKEGQR